MSGANPMQEGRMEYLCWLRTNTTVEGFASLCDDVCSMVARYCEEERWALLQSLNGRKELLTAPLDCTTVLDTRVQRQEWSQNGYCNLYVDSTILKIQGLFTADDRKLLPSYLETSLIEANVKIIDRVYGENGEFKYYNNSLQCPNGIIIGGGTSCDVRYNRIIIVRYGETICEYNTDGVASAFAIRKRSMDIFHSYCYRHHYVLDRTALAQFTDDRVIIYDVREANPTYLNFPTVANQEYAVVTSRNGDVIARGTLENPIGADQNYTYRVHKFDIRGGWVPYYTIGVDDYRRVSGLRGYRG